MHRGRLGHDRHHLRGQPGEVVSGLLVLDVDDLLQVPDARESRRLGLEVRGSVTGQARRVVRLRIGHARLEALVDEEAPHLFVRDLADELLDVDAAIPERTALPVGLGDLGLERDNALEPWFEVVHLPGNL